nr:MAG TPA: nicotinate phosphoribosyltransferase [Caudoviricetes sp.]
MKYRIIVKEEIRCSFGIGTNLTNDVGVKPLNIVMKLLFLVK